MSTPSGPSGELPRTHEDSIVVAAAPDAVYALVSDVTRTGEWSPVCVGCEWDDGATGRVGDWFTGHNRTPEREWSTRSQVVAAEPGRAFGWAVGEGWVVWRYALEPVAGGTRLTESWEFPSAGIARFHELYGERADAQIADRTQHALRGIPATLAAIKAIAEREAGAAGGADPGPRGTRAAPRPR
ncbi:Polyketide cyclase / dehydrase and lipid transport [Jatrophihabitans endophyticus]|uniref:Polyketide cyclase / dehydrase and lipid transport n=1 Tax=Jatrophihabitans endophyticus TaxID=1206085 RepID=A0A1M5MAW0_9ACTN|nr:SRPBCC family protein [Jatrophihabitans endophyticus]SHG74420.1 Polyketide cyclase / dehydrase and lipid transport [Jatrophihabitans endophyticus]